MTAPSMQARGTYALTTRCVYRKLLLTPRTPMLHQGLTYALARAARKTGVVVNHVSIIPNHVHQVVTSTRRNLPAFKRLFVGEASKLVKAYLREHGFEEPENVFTRTHQMRLVNAAAQLVYLHYEDIQPVKDGLVERVADYPGFHTDPGMLMGHDLVVARPPLHFDPDTNPEEERLRIGTTPLLAGEIGTRRVVSTSSVRGGRRSARWGESGAIRCSAPSAWSGSPRRPSLCPGGSGGGASSRPSTSSTFTRSRSTARRRCGDSARGIARRSRSCERASATSSSRRART